MNERKDFKVMLGIGGYKLIDFGGVDISTSKTISGIYNEIENTDKRIVGCNLKLGTTTFKELTLDVKKDGTNLVLSNSIIKVTITNANAVVGEVIKEVVVYDDVNKFKIGIGSISIYPQVSCIFNVSENWIELGTIDEDGAVYLSNHESITALEDFTGGIDYMAIDFRLKLVIVYASLKN